MYPKRALLVFALAVADVACLNLAGDCGNDLVKEVRSPDGQMNAVVFQRDCGATTGFSTQVSLLSSNKSLPNESGNLFVATTDRRLGWTHSRTFMDRRHALVAPV
jgi:hypothetical protein